MKRTKIKICGLTRAGDALAASAAGADALGVVLAPSKRRVTLEQAAEVFAPVPAHVARVGVFVDASVDEMREAVVRLDLTAVQLHGSETPETCEAMGVPVVKALRVGPGFDPAEAQRYCNVVSLFLLDTLVPGEQGGTGVAFDWNSVIGHLPECAPFVVAGGLHAGNVGEVVRLLRPFAVDVSSGVETSPGIKDHQRIEEFIAAVRAADHEVYGK
ncbi:MAG: phosphoribosylanthranilate isomerase [Actinobacteria bacterium]|nr:phosphoribosylanthranilate isomerase [Actinomycetota bacterium]